MNVLTPRSPNVFRTRSARSSPRCMSRIGPDIVYALFTVFTITYGTQHLDLERNQVLVAILIGSAFQLVGIPLAGAISDRINRRLALRRLRGVRPCLER